MNFLVLHVWETLNKFLSILPLLLLVFLGRHKGVGLSSLNVSVV